jgi:amino acid transporter
MSLNKTAITDNKKLGLMGATVNAMALIAPGAFLWITYQMQAAATAPNGASIAMDIWPGIVVALILCFLTALSYSQLAKIFPEAGFASVTYFAEQAFSEMQSGKKSKSGALSLGRISKLVTGWATHLYYWVYPGVMVATMATMIGYLYSQFTGKEVSTVGLVVIGTVFAFATGYIAYRGIVGSTNTAIIINIIQLVTLIIFSALAVWYRISNPEHAAAWSFSGAWDVVKPHTFNGVLIQSTIAILILVGFESCTALSAETKDPGRTIPKAIILSLIIQGAGAYLLEYFAAGTMISEKLTFTSGKPAVTVTGLAAAAGSSAPVGDMAKLIGDNLLGGLGFGLMITMAVTVAIALIGTTLSCMNTAMRISNGLASDRELPEFMGYMHSRYKTPHTALWLLVIVSSVIGAIGVQSVVGLTGITLASNFGTFALYGLTCVWCIIAFVKRNDFNIIRHGIIPALGVIANVIMLIAIIYLYAIGNADSKSEAKICFYIAGGWALLSVGYVIMTSVKKTYSFKMISAMIRPEKLNVLVEVLKDEDLIQGMTVTKVKGFGRQQGRSDISDPDPDLGVPGVTFVSKVRVDLVVNDWDIPNVMEIMREVLNTGEVGDGKIFVFDAREAMRIRTGETGITAI